MRTIDLNKALELIRASNGSIFSVVFIKKNGEIREMTCRLGVKKHLKGGVLGYNPNDFNLVGVFDMIKGDYRMINLETLQRLNIDHENYLVQSHK